MRWVVVLLAALSAPALAVGPGEHLAGAWRVEVWTDVLLWTDPVTGQRHDVPVYGVRCQEEGCAPVNRTIPQGDLELVLLDNGDLVVVLRREGYTDLRYNYGSCRHQDDAAIFADGFESGLGTWSAVDRGAAAAYHHRRSFSYAPASRRQAAGLFLPPRGG